MNLRNRYMAGYSSIVETFVIILIKNVLSLRKPGYIKLSDFEIAIRHCNRITFQCIQKITYIVYKLQ